MIPNINQFLNHVDFSKRKTMQLDHPKLNAELKGLSAGEILMISARPGQGKTQLAYQLALEFSVNYKGILFAFEESVWSSHSRINSIVNESFKINKQTGDLGLFVETEENRWERVKEICQSIEGLDFIVIDSLQLLSEDNRGRRDEKNEEILKEIKQLANKLGIAVVLTSYMDREVDLRGGDRCPQIWDVFTSWVYESKVDKVIAIYAPASYGILEDEEGRDLRGTIIFRILKSYSESNRAGILFESNGTIFQEKREDIIVPFQS